jgi:hypothetical protein
LGALIALDADPLPDEMPVRSLCPRMVCTACGLIGADVRPDWSPHTNGRAIPHVPFDRLFALEPN